MNTFTFRKGFGQRGDICLVDQKLPVFFKGTWFGPEFMNAHTDTLTVYTLDRRRERILFFFKFLLRCVRVDYISTGNQGGCYMVFFISTRFCLFSQARKFFKKSEMPKESENGRRRADGSAVS